MSINYLSTVSDSFPHTDSKDLCQQLVETLDIPVWPQLPKRTFFENMYVQYSNGLPGLEINTKDEKVTFNSKSDLLGKKEFTNRSLVTTSCGLGSTTIEIAEKVLEVQKQTGEILQQA